MTGDALTDVIAVSNNQAVVIDFYFGGWGYKFYDAVKNDLAVIDFKFGNHELKDNVSDALGDTIM